MTAPVLFAIARGEPYSPGSNRCFYCGAPCGETHRSSDLVKDSFTARDTVCGGDWVCGGCVASMNELASVVLANGERRELQRVRCYTWVISESKAVAATKSHREWLLQTCINPPQPPYVICLSDSGQKHLLYRAAVNHSREEITVTLEGERITYQPCQLTKRVKLCKQVAAALGKPALFGSLSINQQMSLATYFDAGTLSAWLSVRSEPLTRLAAWFTPAKKECEIEFPKRDTAARHHFNRRIQATLGGLD